MKVDKYTVDYKEVRAKKIAWVEINANIYNLCLQHSPPDLESVFKANIIWDKIMLDQDIIRLIHVIWYITHKQNNKMMSTMAYVEALLEFAMTSWELKQSKIHYYALFKSRLDTVMANGRKPGYHLKLYGNHWKRLVVTEGIVDDK